MQEGYFTQGHFDVKETTFIVSDEMYAMYRATEENAARVRAEEAKKEAEANVLPPDVRELLTKGEEYIQRIHEANDNIPDRGITDKLDRMEAIVTRIFEEVRKNPSLAGNLNMFMDYYLPTTIKLVGAYEEMDRQQMQGENIRNAKAEISDSLDTINDAFEKLLDSFFADTAMDVSTDISVMKTMMKQEGLTDDDLTAMRKKQATKAAGCGFLGWSANAAAGRTEEAGGFRFRGTAGAADLRDGGTQGAVGCAAQGGGHLRA